MEKPRVALVTGAGRGIGQEVVRLLAEKGLVVWVAARKPDQAKALTEELTTAGFVAHGLTLDVTDDSSVKAAAETVAKEGTGLDILINNAAILLDRGNDMAEISIEALRTTLETNVVGVWRVIQAFLPLLEESSAPRIINVSSGAAQLSDASNWAPAYSVSKTALNGITAQLAVARPRFAINAVSPGWCRTEMGGAGATLSAVEGADSIVWLATVAPQELSGQFIHERRPMAW